MNVTDSLYDGASRRPDGVRDCLSVQQHKRQLPLLLDLFHNQSHNQVQMDLCDLLLG